MYICVILFFTLIYTGFNGFEAARELKLRYDDLSNLSYDAMKGRLYAYDVITPQEKDEIDRLIGSQQMQKVLDILIASLEANQTSKYKGFLQAMEESDDTLLKEKAKELGKLISIMYMYVCMIQHYLALLQQ